MKQYLNLIFLIGLCGCVTTPVTHRKQFIVVPEGQMTQLGKQAFAEILQKEKQSSNRELTARIVKIGERIAKASDVDYKWEFALIEDDKMVNAFCLPGGKVAVYTGILPVAANDAGLAAVIGHEVAHAVLRHGAERMSQTLAAQAGLMAATLSFGDNRYKNIIAGALGVGLQFGVMLPFSRKHEAEADMVGLQYMAKAGYDPHEAVELWQRMAKASGSGVPELISTHPDPRNRAKDLKEEIPKVMSLYNSSEKQESRPLT